MGIEAEATRQATRGELRRYDSLWRIKAAEAGRLRSPREKSKSGDAVDRSRKEAAIAWAHISHALAGSKDAADRTLAEGIGRYVGATPFAPDYVRALEKHREQPQLTSERETARSARPVEREPALR